MPLFINGFEIMLVSRIVIGLGLGIIAPIPMTIIFQQFEDVKQRNNIIGWQGCAGAIGNIATMSLAGFLADYGYRSVFSVHFTGMITFFAVLFLIPGDGTKEEASIKELNTGRMKQSRGKLTFKTIRWFIIAFLYMTFLHCFSINLSMLVEEGGFGSSTISGLGLSMLTVGSFTSGFFYGKIVSFIKQYTMPTGMAFSAFGLLLMGLAYSPVLVYASGVFTGFGMGMVIHVIVTYVVGSAAPEMTTLVIALNGAMTNLGLSVAPYSVSWVSSIFVGESIRGRYYVCAAILLMMGILMLAMAFARKLPNPDSGRRVLKTG
jgi:MFS family permease